MDLKLSRYEERSSPKAVVAPVSMNGDGDVVIKTLKSTGGCGVPSILPNRSSSEFESVEGGGLQVDMTLDISYVKGVGSGLGGVDVCRPRPPGT